MRYKPELGFFGNLERAFEEMTKTNNKVFNTENTANNTADVVSAQLGVASEQNAEQFRKAVQMFAASLSDEQAMEVATVYDEWQSGKTYKANTYITYGYNSVGDPQLYKVVQEHTSQEDWTPDVTPSLFTPIGLDENGYPVWSAPTGSHDAYNTGDIVDYNGTLYKSLIDGNVYSPEAYPSGWEVVE